MIDIGDYLHFIFIGVQLVFLFAGIYYVYSRNVCLFSPLLRAPMMI
jgi:hypothetical protein